jgi:hypothetical protein
MRCQGVKVLKYKEVPNVPRCQGVKVPRLKLNFSLSGAKVPKVSRCQGRN